jgi:formylglycine-generating enzyme required for sulfatase activity
MKLRLKICTAFFLLLLSPLYPDYTYLGVVESIRDKGYITVIFSSDPEREEYYIFSNSKIIGKVFSLKNVPDIYGKKRFLCRYALSNDEYGKILRPGLDVGIITPDKDIDKRMQKTPFTDTTQYKPEIYSPVDNRPMVLIPEGKFLMGCSHGNNDEYPEHAEFLGNYYIDKFEVSNNHYRKYADIKGLKYPEYWEKNLDAEKKFTPAYFGDLPVIVTYMEAAGYARWTKKRLPDEKEWEKAARMPADMDSGGKSSLYSWGSEFREGLANTEELWLNEKTGENLKKMFSEKYGLTLTETGYIPVDIYEKESLTYYGVAHMDGNATEWTSSWYRPYPMNNKNNKKFGEQYKVIRGGSFFLPKNDSRITDRKTGGIPDLYKDRIAGFRCVKNVAENDKK